MDIIRKTIIEKAFVLCFEEHIPIEDAIKFVLKSHFKNHVLIKQMEEDFKILI